MQRWALMGVVMGCLAAMGLVAPANAAGTTQISGSGYYDDAAGTECGPPPAPFDDYPGLILTGSLDGCLFTDRLTATDHGAERDLPRDRSRADRRQHERRAGGDVHDDLQVRVQVEPGRVDRRGGQGPLPAPAC